MLFDFQFEHESHPVNVHCDHCANLIKKNAYRMLAPSNGILCGQCYVAFEPYIKKNIEHTIEESCVLFFSGQTFRSEDPFVDLDTADAIFETLFR